MKFEEGPPSDAAVVQGLSALRRDGGSVLVVGAPHGGHTEVCQRFLGGDAECVLVSTDGSVHCDAETAAVVDRPVQTRSAATATPTASPTGLETLDREIRAAIADLETEGEDGDAGRELRLCFDSLRPYVASTPEPELVSFLETLRGTAREAGAVVHVHLPAMADDVPASLPATVDAVVELRRRGDATYQQWTIPGREATSEWLPV